jgi:hypothetical protein
MSGCAPVIGTKPLVVGPTSDGVLLTLWRRDSSCVLLSIPVTTVSEVHRLVSALLLVPSEGAFSGGSSAQYSSGSSEQSIIYIFTPGVSIAIFLGSSMCYH